MTGRIIHRVDTSACRATMLRRWCGGLKHITVKSLWVQEAVREYAIEIARISRDEMHAHILASPCSADELTKHLKKLNGCRIKENEEFEYEPEGSMSAGDNVRGRTSECRKESMSAGCLLQWHAEWRHSPVVTCWRKIEFELLNQEQEELKIPQRMRCWVAAIHADWCGTGRKFDPSEYVPSK